MDASYPGSPNTSPRRLPQTPLVQAPQASQSSVYSSSGPVPQGTTWYGTATVDASGNFSVSISSAGFSSTPNVTVSVKTLVGVDAVILKNLTVTSSLVSGSVKGILETLGTLGWSLSGISGTVLNIQAVGN